MCYILVLKSLKITIKGSGLGSWNGVKDFPLILIGNIPAWYESFILRNSSGTH